MMTKKTRQPRAGYPIAPHKGDASGHRNIRAAANVTPKNKAWLKAIKKRNGMSVSDVLDFGIRQLAKRDGIPEPTEEEWANLH